MSEQKKTSETKETIIEKTYKLLVYSLPVLSKFPRSQKFLLADRIELIFIELLELYIEAYYGSGDIKIQNLTKANRKLETARLLTRLSYEMKYIGLKQYEQIVKHLFEIGTANGAWLKTLKIK